MFKKSISVVLFAILILSGCSGKSVAENKMLNTVTAANKQNNTNNEKSIPFDYAYTGFVQVKDIYNDLPVGTKVFNTQQEWTEFKNKYMPCENVPWPGYVGEIDFSKDSLIYYSMLDAKADIYAQAWLIDKITLENEQITVYPKDMDNELKITATNTEKFGGHRFVIVVIVSKDNLKSVS